MNYLDARHARNIIEHTVYTETNMRTKIQPRDLQGVSCFDLCLTDRSDLVLQSVLAPTRPDQFEVNHHHEKLMPKLRDSVCIPANPSRASS